MRIVNAPAMALRRISHALRHPSVSFVASDEASVIRFIEGEFPSLRVVSCDDQRSEGNIAIHQLDFAGGNYDKGRQALVN